MSRQRYLSIIIPIFGFLAFLGMRVPDISRPHDPKPRPRAVIQHLFKASEEVCHHLPFDAATPLSVIVTHPVGAFCRILPQPATPVVSIASAPPSSRGPPVA